MHVFFDLFFPINSGAYSAVSGDPVLRSSWSRFLHGIRVNIVLCAETIKPLNRSYNQNIIRVETEGIMPFWFIKSNTKLNWKKKIIQWHLNDGLYNIKCQNAIFVTEVAFAKRSYFFILVEKIHLQHSLTSIYLHLTHKICLPLWKVSLDFSWLENTLLMFFYICEDETQIFWFCFSGSLTWATTRDGCFSLLLRRRRLPLLSMLKYLSPS